MNKFVISHLDYLDSRSSLLEFIENRIFPKHFQRIEINNFDRSNSFSRHSFTNENDIYDSTDTTDCNTDYSNIIVNSHDTIKVDSHDKIEIDPKDSPCSVFSDICSLNYKKKLEA